SEVIGDRLREAGHQAVEIADMIVDLRADETGFGERELQRFGLFGAPLVPDADADQRGERRDRCQDEAQQPQSDALEHSFPTVPSLPIGSSRWPRVSDPLAQSLIFSGVRLGPCCYNPRAAQNFSDTLNQILIAALDAPEGSAKRCGHRRAGRI